MDPVSGVGLVAAIIQIVSLGIDTVKTVREIYEQGSASNLNDLGVAADHLASLNQSLSQSLQSCGGQSQILTKDEKDLLDLSHKCQKCARDLQEELQKLRCQPGSSLLAATASATKALWRKHKIEGISKQLETFRSTLEFSLLHRLSRRFDEQGVRTEQSFTKLDKDLQQLITHLAESRISLAALAIRESDHTRAHTTDQIHQLEKRQSDDRLYKEVLDSLFYPDIFSRQEQVDHIFDGIEDSYQWIFQKPNTDRDKVPLWHDFSEWLQSGHGVYWINGKAAAGKSTLMNYICQHEHKRQLLQQWAAGKMLLAPSYFFWSAGSRLQKSVDGLLRSLIYQMLKECRELFIERPHAWTESRLLATLQSLLRQTQVQIAVFLQIDGLDEIEGQYHSIINLIRDLLDCENLKICLASRPLPLFQKEFSTQPGLKLQDLTYASIKAYAEHKLSQVLPELIDDNARTAHRIQYLLTKVAAIADGVFLWAVLAVRNIRDGLEGHADLDELERLIDSLPPELENLFMAILRRIRPAYQRDAARYLQIILQAPVRRNYIRALDTLTLRQMHLIYSQQEVEDEPLIYEPIAMGEVVEACKTLKDRLLSHTAGLLEVTAYKYDKTQDSITNSKINWLHRTARDFLIQNDEAMAFIAHRGLSKVQVHRLIARGVLAESDQYRESDERHSFLKFDAALHHVSLAERMAGEAQSKLMKSLEIDVFMERKDFYFYHTGSRREYRFVIHNGGSTYSIDLVGMAASVGMTLYVCERLGISSVIRTCALPCTIDRDKCQAWPITLRWTQQGPQEDPSLDVACQLPCSDYRQALHRCLKVYKESEVAQHGESADAEISESAEQYPNLAESYLLSCCEPVCSDLIRILLVAGANPMVMGENSQHFWRIWLKFLNSARLGYIERHGRSGGVLLEKKDLDLGLTPQALFEITKTLITSGADINYTFDVIFEESLKHLDSGIPWWFFQSEAWVTINGSFILEECFNKEPGFGDLVAKPGPELKTSLRTLHHSSYKASESRYIRVDFTAEHNATLWPLIEKWEKTGNQSDLDALNLALDEIYPTERDRGF
ncbi:MAG: hypothetical protein Q9219_006954 [cf. Caloplaca sp. 3 TL-2023]